MNVFIPLFLAISASAPVLDLLSQRTAEPPYGLPAPVNLEPIEVVGEDYESSVGITVFRDSFAVGSNDYLYVLGRRIRGSLICEWTAEKGLFLNELRVLPSFREENIYEGMKQKLIGLHMETPFVLRRWSIGEDTLQAIAAWDSAVSDLSREIHAAYSGAWAGMQSTSLARQAVERIVKSHVGTLLTGELSWEDGKLITPMLGNVGPFRTYEEGLRIPRKVVKRNPMPTYARARRTIDAIKRYLTTDSRGMVIVSSGGLSLTMEIWHPRKEGPLDRALHQLGESSPGQIAAGPIPDHHVREIVAMGSAGHPDSSADSSAIIERSWIYGGDLYVFGNHIEKVDNRYLIERSASKIFANGCVVYPRPKPVYSPEFLKESRRQWVTDSTAGVLHIARLKSGDSPSSATREVAEFLRARDDIDSVTDVGEASLWQWRGGIREYVQYGRSVVASAEPKTESPDPVEYYFDWLIEALSDFCVVVLPARSGFQRFESESEKEAALWDIESASQETGNITSSFRSGRVLHVRAARDFQSPRVLECNESPQFPNAICESLSEWVALWSTDSSPVTLETFKRVKVESIGGYQFDYDEYLLDIDVTWEFMSSALVHSPDGRFALDEWTWNIGCDSLGLFTAPGPDTDVCLIDVATKKATRVLSGGTPMRVDGSCWMNSSEFVIGGSLGEHSRGWRRLTIWHYDLITGMRTRWNGPEIDFGGIDPDQEAAVREWRGKWSLPTRD